MAGRELNERRQRQNAAAADLELSPDVLTQIEGILAGGLGESLKKGLKAGKRFVQKLTDR